MGHKILPILLAALIGCTAENDPVVDGGNVGGAGDHAGAGAGAGDRMGNDPAGQGGAGSGMGTPGNPTAGADPTMNTPNPAGMPGPGAMPGDAAGYMAMAAASDQYEIQSSEMALQKTKRDDVRAFAQMMIEHHRKTTEDLKAAAQRADLTAPPPTLDARKQQMIDQLQAAAEGDFDRTYLQQQTQAHEEARALHSHYAQNGDNPELKAAAQATVPIIDQHRAELDRMNAATH